MYTHTHIPSQLPSRNPHIGPIFSHRNAWNALKPIVQGPVRKRFARCGGLSVTLLLDTDCGKVLVARPLPCIRRRRTIYRMLRNLHGQRDNVVVVLDCSSNHSQCAVCSIGTTRKKQQRNTEHIFQNGRGSSSPSTNFWGMPFRPTWAPRKAPTRLVRMVFCPGRLRVPQV